MVTLSSVPPSVTHLTFSDTFNEPIHELPATLIQLDLGRYFNNHIDSLPPSLAHLFFSSNYNHPLPVLPTSLTHLMLGERFTYPLDTLPQSLVCLFLMGNYFYPLNNLLPLQTIAIFGYCDTTTLPPSITRIILPNWLPSPPLLPNLTSVEWRAAPTLPVYYKRFINSTIIDTKSINFPPSMTHLNMENLPFDLPIIVPFLTHLTLSYSYNQPLVLPASLTHFTAGGSFNKPLNLPSNLLHLELGYAYTHQIINFPTKLQYLKLGSNYQHHLDRLPASILHLHVDTQANSFPSSLIHLSIREIHTDSLPSSLTHLSFYKSTFPIQQLCRSTPSLSNLTISGGKFDQISDLPSSIVVLDIYDYCGQITSLPPKLKDLSLGCNDQIEFNLNSFPNTLTHLTFSYYFDQPISFLPPTITHLTIDTNFNQPISSLPSSITHLAIGKNIPNTLPLTLPPYLISLVIPARYAIPLGTLPLSMKTVTLLHRTSTKIFLAECPVIEDGVITHLFSRNKYYEVVHSIVCFFYFASPSFNHSFCDRYQEGYA